MKKLLSPKTLRALCASLGTLLCVAGLCPILAGCQRAPSDPPLETEINGGETATDTIAPPHPGSRRGVHTIPVAADARKKDVAKSELIADHRTIMTIPTAVMRKNPSLQ